MVIHIGCQPPSIANAQTQINSMSAAPLDDTEYRANWGLGLTNTLAANALGFTGQGVSVAIIDSGLEVDHPEFAGRVSPLSRNFGNALAPDDVRDIKPGGAIEGHGTHVTGIIGAARDGRGVQGVAYGATLIPLRVIVDDPGPIPGLSVQEHLLAIRPDVVNGSFGPPTLRRFIRDPLDPEKIIPNSNYRVLGYHPIYQSPAQLVRTYEDLKALAEADTVIVSSAGNGYLDQPIAATLPHGYGLLPLVTPDNTQAGFYGFVSLPGGDVQNGSDYELLDPDDPSIAELDFSELKGAVISVVAVRRDGRITSYSNECGLAAAWCLAAPGGERSTRADPTRGVLSTFPESEYRFAAGTSMAAPHVSGAAALVREAFPYLTARQTVETILTTATDLGNEQYYGQGLLNVGAAVRGPMEFRYDGVFDVDTDGLDSVWSNPISGPGGLTKRGDGALTLAGDNSYLGDTRVLRGALVVDGTLQSRIVVAGEGRLSGGGTVRELAVTQRGVVSPGSSSNPSVDVEELTVDGALTFGPEATYEVTIGPSGSTDQLIVLEAITIDEGATLAFVDGRADRLSAGAELIVLESTDGVVGDFSIDLSEFADRPFLDFDVSQDSDDVALAVDRSALAFTSVAQTANQSKAASASEALGPGFDVYDAVLNLDETSAPRALDQISGEIHASLRGGLVEQSLTIGGMAAERINRSSRDATGRDVESASVGAVASFLPSSATDGALVWGQAFGEVGSVSAGYGVADRDSDHFGFVGGAELAVDEEFRLGVLVGYGDNRLSLVGRNATSSIESGHFGAYGTFAPDQFRAVAGLIYSYSDIETERRVSFGALSEMLDSSYSAHSFHAFGELAYRAEFRAGRLEPYIAVNHIVIDATSFQETGGSAALAGDGDSSSTTFGTIGIRSTTELSLEAASAEFTAGVGWRRAFRGRTPYATVGFDGSQPFAVRGAPVAQDVALVEAGVSVDLSGHSSLRFGYSGSLSEDYQAHRGGLALVLQF